MTTSHFIVAATIPLDAITDTLQIAVVATECLHDGTTAPALTYQFDPEQRVLMLPTGSKVAADFECLVCGLLTRSFGAHACDRRAKPETTTHDDSSECRTLFDWADQLGLDPDEVRDLLKENPGVHLDDPLTEAQMSDLIGMTLLAQRSTRE